MAATLAGLRQTRRSENLSAEFLRAAHVDHDRIASLLGLLHLWQERADRIIRAAGLVRTRAGRGFARHRFQITGLGKPLLAAAIHDPDVFVAIYLHLPEGPGGEPVVVVTV